jgi:PAS domain S-box-containing protein
MSKQFIERLKRDLEEVLHSADAAWWEWDFQNNRVACNDLKVTALGYSVEEFENVGYQAFTDLLHPDDYERAMDAMRAHLAGTAPIYQIDYRIQRKDGSYTWYLDRGYIIERTENGEPARLRGVVFDMGEDYDSVGDKGEVISAIRSILPRAERVPPGGNKDLVTVCMVCRRLRLPSGEWVAITEQLPEILPGHVSHGLCEECADVMYPDYRKKTR